MLDLVTGTFLRNRLIVNDERESRVCLYSWQSSIAEPVYHNGQNFFTFEK